MLVKSLSIKERELFRFHSFPPNLRTQKAIQWQMFKLLCNMESYQPEKLYKLFAEKDWLKTQRLLGVNKFELKRKLLLFIGTLADESIVQRHIQLQAINVLYHRGLYKECHKQANLFKKEQIEVGQNSYATIANFYALMSAEFGADTNNTDLIAKYTNEQVRLCEEAYTNACMYRIYTRLYVIQLGGVLITGKALRSEIQKLAADPIFKNKPEELSFNTRRYYYMAKAIAARLTGDIKNAVFYTEKEYSLGQNDKGKKQPTDEMQSIADVIHSHILAGNPNKVKAWLKIFYAQLKHYKLNPLNYKYLTLHFELALAVLHRRNEHKKDILPAVKSSLHEKLIELESYYLNNFTLINTGIRKIFETDLAMGFYEYGDLNKSLRYVNAFLEQDVNAEMGSRIIDIYQLFALLVKYDLVQSGNKKNNVERFANKCAKLRRKLLVKSLEHDVSVELAFLDTFDAIIKNFFNKVQVKQAFIKLLNTLNKLNRDEASYLSQLNNIFNLIEWVKCRSN